MRSEPRGRRGGVARRRARAPPLPLHALPRPAEAVGAPGGRARPGGSRAGRAGRRCHGRRASDCASGSRCRRAASNSPRPCSACTRIGSSSGWRRSSAGSRAICARRRSSPRFASPSCMPCCPRAGWASAAPDPVAANRRRHDPRQPTGNVARAQPVARLRGRLPPGPRLRAATRGRRPGADGRALRVGPAQPRRGLAERRGPRHDPRRPRRESRRESRSGRGSGSSSGSRPPGSARSGSRRHITGRRGRSGGRRQRCCHSRPCSGAPCARRGRGRRRRSGGRSRRSRPISPTRRA